jgi:hypothetical protein
LGNAWSAGHFLFLQERNKRLQVMDNIGKVEVRQLNINDYEEMYKSLQEAYPNWPEDYWEKKDIRKLVKIFPEGQFAVVVDDVVVGSALSIIVKYELFGDDHTYEEIRERFLNLAITYNINIVTGSFPLVKDEKLYNTGFLCRRNGTWETCQKWKTWTFSLPSRWFLHRAISPFQQQE